MPSPPLQFDLVVIGSSREGVAAVELARDRGLAVALVPSSLEARLAEERWIALRSRAERLRSARQERGGLDERFRAIARRAWEAAQDSARTRAGDDSLAALCAKLDVRLLEGSVRFRGPSELETDEGVRISAERFVLATGSRPRREGAFDYDGEALVDGDQLLGAAHPPRELVIVGADWLGSEWAFLCAMFGANVTLLDRRARLLRALDPEIQQAVKSSLFGLGVEIVLEERVEQIRRGRHGGCQVQLESGRHEVTEQVLVLGGRLGNTAGLGLDEIGVTLDAQQHVVVDHCFRSSVPNVFAIGRVAEPNGLFEAGRFQAEIAIESALGHSAVAPDRTLPWVLHSSWEVALCGLSAEACRQLDLDVVEGRASVEDRSEAPTRLAKVVVGASDHQLLGAQLAGPGAGEAIGLVCEAMDEGRPIEALRTITSPPNTMSDTLRRACRAASEALSRPAPPAVPPLRLADRER